MSAVALAKAEGRKSQGYDQPGIEIMKRAACDQRKSRTGRIRLLFLTLLSAFFAFSAAVFTLAATHPAWWADRGVTVSDPNTVTNDFAPATQGQLKWIATQAAAELAEKLPGGAGPNVAAIVAAFTTNDNYAPVAIGQAKTVVAPIYDRLIAVGYATNYPWTSSTSPPNDFAPLNLGQLKHLFSFDIATDTDSDGMPDWWEIKHGLNPTDGGDANAILNDAGLTAVHAFMFGQDPRHPTFLEFAQNGGDGSLLFEFWTPHTVCELHYSHLRPGIPGFTDPNAYSYLNSRREREAIEHFEDNIGDASTWHDTIMQWDEIWYDASNNTVAYQSEMEECGLGLEGICLSSNYYYRWQVNDLAEYTYAFEQSCPEYATNSQYVAPSTNAWNNTLLNPSVPSTNTQQTIREGSISNSLLAPGDNGEYSYRYSTDYCVQYLSQPYSRTDLWLAANARLDSECDASTNSWHTFQYDEQEDPAKAYASGTTNGNWLHIRRMYYRVLCEDAPTSLQRVTFYRIFVPSGQYLSATNFSLLSVDHFFGRGSMYMLSGDGVGYAGGDGEDGLRVDPLADRDGSVHVVQAGFAQGAEQGFTFCWEAGGSSDLSPCLLAGFLRSYNASNTVRWSMTCLDGAQDANLNATGTLTFGSAGGQYAVTATALDDTSLTLTTTITVARLVFTNSEAYVAWTNGGSFDARACLSTDSIPRTLSWPALDGMTNDAFGKYCFGPGGGRYTIMPRIPASPGSCTTSMVLNVIKVDLDVNGNKSLEDLVDGVDTYTPGCRPHFSLPQVPVLSTGLTYEAPGYVGQGMIIMLTNAGFAAGLDEVQFSLDGCSSLTGFCENATAPGLDAPGHARDYSFSPSADENQIVVTTTSSDTGLQGGMIESNRVWVRFWCKDYGGTCTVRVVARSGGQDRLVFPPLVIPLDADGDGVADLYEVDQHLKWTLQYGYAPGNLGDPNYISAFCAADDSEAPDADGSINADGGRNLPAHKTGGDGLTCVEEYRGYILDGGPQFYGGHKRLSFARKDLLVEISEQTNMLADVGTGDVVNTNAMASYNLGTVMHAVSDFYCDINHGAGIDVHWVRDAFRMPSATILSNLTLCPRSNRYQHIGPLTYKKNTNVMITGSTWIMNDLSIQDMALRKRLYPYEAWGKPSLLIEHNRNDGELKKFIKAVLVSRCGYIEKSGRVVCTGDNAVTLYQEDSFPWRELGIEIDCVSMSEENAALNSGPNYSASEFIAHLSYAAAHEAAHSLSRLPDDHDAAHIGRLMAGFSPLSILTPIDDEINGLTVTERTSIQR